MENLSKNIEKSVLAYVKEFFTVSEDKKYLLWRSEMYSEIDFTLWYVIKIDIENRQVVLSEHRNNVYHLPNGKIIEGRDFIEKEVDPINYSLEEYMPNLPTPIVYLVKMIDVELLSFL